MGPEERLSKFLEHSGVSSRRKAEQIIQSGRVTVNGLVVGQPQFKVVADRDVVKLDNKIVKRSQVRLYVALYKPVRVLSDLNFSDDREIARNFIKVDAYLFPVGRLDYQSEGLIIFTNDGDFANKVMHPKFEVEKEYLVKFKGVLTEDEMKLVNRGVAIDGSLYKVSSILPLKTSTTQNAWYKVVIHEGKNRMIRKIGDKIGHAVLRLKRVRIGNVKLGALKPGEYRFIEERDIKTFRRNRQSS
jgi:23S rRNA pseudouridine2605 synthase